MIGHRILDVLKRHYRPYTALCVATLARFTKASENRVREVAKELEKNGHIARKRGFPMAFQHIPAPGSPEAKERDKYEAKLRRQGWLGVGPGLLGYKEDDS